MFLNTAVGHKEQVILHALNSHVVLSHISEIVSSFHDMTVALWVQKFGTIVDCVWCGLFILCYRVLAVIGRLKH